MLSHKTVPSSHIRFVAMFKSLFCIALSDNSKHEV